MNYFETVGQEIEASIAQSSSSTSFADIATRVLQEIEPPADLDFTMVHDWICSRDELPDQAKKGGFGQPEVVVYYHERFIVELIVWFPSSTAIHGHGFEGAFRVLRGASLEAEYSFIPQSKPCEGLELGQLKLESVELIGPGQVSTIGLGDTFVHQVAHLGNPSLTLVARTNSSQTKDVEQLSYFRSGLAYSHFRRKVSIDRQIQTLMAMRRARPKQFPQHLRNFLSNGDLHRRFICLYRLCVDHPGSAWDDLLEESPLPGSEPVDVKIAETLAEVRRVQQLQNALLKFRAPTKQLLFSLEVLLGPKGSRDKNLDPPAPLFEKWRKVVAAEY